MDSYKAVIDAWADRAAFAADLGIKPSLANVWFHRDSLPSEHWNRVVSMATERGIKGVTLELLARLAAEKKPRLSESRGEAA